MQPTWLPHLLYICFILHLLYCGYLGLDLASSILLGRADQENQSQTGVANPTVHPMLPMTIVMSARPTPTLARPYGHA